MNEDESDTVADILIKMLSGEPFTLDGVVFTPSEATPSDEGVEE